MARALTAYLARKDVPDRKSLQKALDALKLKITLDDGYAPFKSVSYLPCTFDGEDAGFDIRFQDAPADPAPNLKAALGEQDTAIAFRWGGDIREQACVMAVCTALARDFGAIVHEDEGDKIIASDDLFKKAKNAADSL
ncbi:hypothetical protein [Beijerinckia indica]|uniref:Uncharacterized protein n=1 Tax=Beijerinckia indica subsp. indica (strain ATCC 9039 / DSM 1715 / NCIMB 8712) TaxID=395963 RepID=B2IEQ6_BEII9|nr:hypothetical protein [Beijerinckia indica]ACB96996.1 conserved hypothetical protein [Beijerinckia indica subsp. indica ATCC 9039]